MRRKIIWGLMLMCITGIMYAQSFNELAEAYSGKVSWDATTATVAFEESGMIYFDKTDTCKNYYWDVPAEVKVILIKANTKVTGAFHTYANCFIKGEDRKTSVIYGVDEQSWANNRELSAWKFSHILNNKGVLRMENLTMLNPFSFFVRSFKLETHIAFCDFIDNRGGHHNHSDGVVGGDGSTVDNCYFAAGDDAIKVYDDITVTNTTFNMVTNCVPIQLGWGNYSDGAVGTFKNITIIGNSGRHSSDNAIICGRKGEYEVTINIQGCDIQNPNAVLVSLWEPTMTLNGVIVDAHIEVGAYTKQHTAGTNNLEVCGSKEQKSTYNCRIGKMEMNMTR